MEGLQSVIAHFEDRVKGYGDISEGGVNISIVGNYAVLEAIVLDGDDFFSFSQEIEFSDGKISALYLNISRF